MLLSEVRKDGLRRNGCLPGAQLSYTDLSVSQFHISGLFPRKRGFISALFVAGFTGCGIIFYVLDRIFEDLGGHRCAGVS